MLWYSWYKRVKRCGTHGIRGTEMEKPLTIWTGDVKVPQNFIDEGR